MTAPAKNVLLVGPPRVGKTTVVQKVLSLVKVRAGGFFTRAAEKDSFFTTFRIVTVDGKNRTLSDQDLIQRFEIPGLVGFNMEDLESRGAQAARSAVQSARLVVLDQLGTLELSSPAFRQVVEAALDAPVCCLATLSFSNDPFLARIRRRADVIEFPVSMVTRSVVADAIASHLHAALAHLEQKGASIKE